VRRYFVTVNAADGRLVATRDIAATGDPTQSVTISEGLPPGDYETQVFAFDGAVPDPFVAASEKRAFKVSDQPPGVASSDPANGATLAYSRRNDNLVLTFDREMDPTTVNNSTVTLRRDGTLVGYNASCSTPCLSVVVDPTGGPVEGNYELAASAGVKSIEGAALQPYTGAFRANFYDNAFTSCDGFDDGPWACAGGVLSAGPPRTPGLQTFTSIGPAVPYVASVKQLRMTFQSTYAEGSGVDSGSAGFAYSGSPATCSTQVIVPVGTLQQSFSLTPPGGTTTVAPCFVLTLAPGSSGASGTSWQLDDLVVDRAP
jgi:hypothetical protein